MASPTARAKSAPLPAAHSSPAAPQARVSSPKRRDSSPEARRRHEAITQLVLEATKGRLQGEDISVSVGSSFAEDVEDAFEDLDISGKSDDDSRKADARKISGVQRRLATGTPPIPVTAHDKLSHRAATLHKQAGGWRSWLLRSASKQKEEAEAADEAAFIVSQLNLSSEEIDPKLLAFIHERRDFIKLHRKLFLLVLEGNQEYESFVAAIRIATTLDFGVFREAPEEMTIDIVEKQCTTKQLLLLVMELVSDECRAIFEKQVKADEPELPRSQTVTWLYRKKIESETRAKEIADEQEMFRDIDSRVQGLVSILTDPKKDKEEDEQRREEDRKLHEASLMARLDANFIDDLMKMDRARKPKEREESKRGEDPVAAPKASPPPVPPPVPPSDIHPALALKEQTHSIQKQIRRMRGGVEEIQTRYDAVELGLKLTFSSERTFRTSLAVIKDNRDFIKEHAALVYRATLPDVKEILEKAIAFVQAVELGKRTVEQITLADFGDKRQLSNPVSRLVILALLEERLQERVKHLFTLTPLSDSL